MDSIHEISKSSPGRLSENGKNVLNRLILCQRYPILLASYLYYIYTLLIP